MAKSMAQSDCHVYTHPRLISYDFVEAKVYCENSEKPQIKHIAELKQYRIKFKTDLQYWYYVINYIKEKILINLPDLRRARIYINTFNKNNVIHQFILSVSDFINKILKKQFVLNQVIFIYIQYEHEIKFIGNV